MENLQNTTPVPSYCEKTESLGYFQAYSNVLTKKRLLFKLNHGNGDVCNMFVKATMTIAPLNFATSTVGVYTGAQLLKSATLRTDDSIICTQTVTSLYGKVDEYEGTPMFTRLKDSLGPYTFPISLADPQSVTYLIPLMFFFNRRTPLQLSGRQQMYVEIEEAGTQLLMGFQPPINLTGTKYELHVRYVQVNRPLPKPKALTVPSYYVEAPVVCGATSARLLLKCPYKVTKIYAMVVRNTRVSLVNIVRLVLSCPTSTIMDLSYDENMICSDPTDTLGFNPGSTFCLKIADKVGADNFLIFNQSMYPCYLDAFITSNPSLGNYELRVVCEYQNEISADTRVITKAIFT